MEADLEDSPARTALSRTEQASLSDLLRMLSRHALSGAALTRAVEHLQRAGCDPELGELGGSAAFMTFALASELIEKMASSECLPQLHAQLSDLLPQPLPQMPASGAAPHGYFAWLDEQLSERHREWGGLAALALELGLDRRVRLLLVYRRDVPRILRLAQCFHLPVACTAG